MQKKYKEGLLLEARKSIFSYFINNTKIAFLVAIWIILWWLSAWVVIPKESAPEIEYGLAVISTVYPWASAVDIDSLVTQEIENKIKNVDWISKFSSNSKNSLSIITVEFDPGTNMIKAMGELRSKLDEAKMKLPEDTEDPAISEVNSNEEVLALHISWEVHPILLRDYAEKIKTFLWSFSYIQDVSISWWADREIYVDLDPKKLTKYLISPVEVISSIRQANSDRPIWNLTLDYLDYDLRINWRFVFWEDVKNVPIKANSSSEWKSIVLVWDLWNVREVSKEDQAIQALTIFDEKKRLNTVRLWVKKNNKVDIYKVDPWIKKEVEIFAKENFWDEVRIDYTFESLKQVKKSFWDVFRSWSQSVVIVFILLFLFIWFKEAVLAWIVIPLTFLTTILALKMISESSTLNFMTNFSMILSLWILVDTAIVIVEWIHDWVKKWFSPKEASLIALQEFKAPLISWTLTTLAVFIPLLSLPWILWKYLSYIPITVSITLIASLFISLLLVPAIAIKYFESKQNLPCGNEKQSCWIKILFDEYRSWYEWKQDLLKKQYESFMHSFLKSRKNRLWLIYWVIIIFVLSMFIPAKFEMFPWDDFDFFQASITMPAWTNTLKTNDISKKVEQVITQQPEVKNVSANINNNKANISIELFEKDTRIDRWLRTNFEIVDDLQEIFSSDVWYDIRISKPKRWPPNESPVAFRVIASDSSKIKDAQRVVWDFKEILKNIDWSYWVKDDLTNTPWEIKYTIDMQKAYYLWVNPAQISTIIKTAVSWVESSHIVRWWREVKIVVRYDKSWVTDFDDIENIQIPNNAWNTVSLSQVLKKELTSWFTNIKRTDWEVSITLSSDLDKEWNAIEVTNAFKKEIETYNFPAWVSIKDAWENTENQDLFIALWIWFVTAIFLMFVILVIQFNSYVYPLIIIFTIIMAQLWVNVWLFLTWTFRSLAFIIWVISLAWIVVNDAIILIDRINNLRKQNPSQLLEKVISTAGESRLQPIILTTLTTAAWVLPLMWVDNFWAGLSVTIIFWLSTASFLTLFVTPALYYQFTKEPWLTATPLALIISVVLLIVFIFKMSIFWSLIFWYLSWFFYGKIRGIKISNSPNPIKSHN